MLEDVVSSVGKKEEGGQVDHGFYMVEFVLCLFNTQKNRKIL